MSEVTVYRAVQGGSNLALFIMLHKTAPVSLSLIWQFLVANLSLLILLIASPNGIHEQNKNTIPYSFTNAYYRQA